MVIFKSPHPDLKIPENTTTWEWAFDNSGQATSRSRLKQRPGFFINVETENKLEIPQLKTFATQLCTALTQKYGFRPGDTVSIFSKNSTWYPVALWATTRGGGRVNGASPDYNVEELSHVLKAAKTRFIVTQAQSLAVVLEAARNVRIPWEHVFLLEGQASGVVNIQTLIQMGAKLPPSPAFRIPAHNSNKDICGFLTFSSGTTGLPKAVMISHHNVIAQCLQQEQLHQGPFRMLAVMPLYHINGLIRFCIHPVYMNGDTFLLPNFSMEAMLGAICKYQLTEIHLVPPIIIRLVHDKIVDSFDLKHVRRWSSGSAPIAPEILGLMQRKFPGTGFRQGYGATESTGIISATAPGFWDYKYAATGGMLAANTEMKVVHLTTGKDLGPNQTGELFVRGPQIAMGYLGNPAATAETFDEWYHTGDVGYVDDRGFIHIKDRIKEMIKVKGIQVAPAELEDLLLGHPKVADCAVLGIPDDYAGERPKAYVVLRESGDKHTQEEIGRQLLQFVKENKIRSKWIKEIEFSDTIPKSPSGKLLRRSLKAQERQSDRFAGTRVTDLGRQSRL